METRNLSSPNHMIWEYFASLKRQAGRAVESPENEESQETALTIFMAVTVVEIFLNLYLRVVVSEPQFNKHQKQLIKDLKSRVSLERKIRNWPFMIFGSELNEESPAIRKFSGLKELRNTLMHFVSSHESMEMPGLVIVHGLVDTTKYTSLKSSLAKECPEIVRGFAFEIFRLHGVEDHKLPGSFHAWFGEVPSNHAPQPTQ